MVDDHIKEETDAINASAQPLTPAEVVKLRKSLASQRELALERGEDPKKRKVLDYDDISNKKIKSSNASATVYMVNYERFHMDKRNSEISALGSKCINETAGHVLDGFLDVLLRSMSHIHEKVSKPLTMMSLSSSLPQMEYPVTGNPANPLAHYLDALATYDPKLLARTDERGGGEFVVRFDACVTELKTRLIISILQERCGTASCRIWRLLLLKQKLDEKQISKLALMNEKDLRVILYSMLKMGMVYIQVYFVLFRMCRKVWIIPQPGLHSCGMLIFVAHVEHFWKTHIKSLTSSKLEETWSWKDAPLC